MKKIYNPTHQPIQSLFIDGTKGALPQLNEKVTNSVTPQSIFDKLPMTKRKLGKIDKLIIAVYSAKTPMASHH